MFVIVAGSPIDGIEIFGPYTSYNEAILKAYSIFKNDNYWIAPLRIK